MTGCQPATTCTKVRCEYSICIGHSHIAAPPYSTNTWIILHICSVLYVPCCIWNMFHIVCVYYIYHWLGDKIKFTKIQYGIFTIRANVLTQIL